MISIVVRFKTDGDYCVNDEVAGLTSPPGDDYCHGGVFLCADTDKAEETLERIFEGIDAEGYLRQEFVQMFAEAQCALGDPDAMRFGWLKQISGNYDGTLLFMQEVTDKRGKPKKPASRESEKFQCEVYVCPVCGHIVEDTGTWERFDYCSACGQRIDWSIE